MYLLVKMIYKQVIDELRRDVWFLLCVFDKDNPDFQCVFEDVEKSGGIARFNDTDE